MLAARVNRVAAFGAAPAPAARRAAVVVRVKPTKAADMKAMSNEELLTKAASLKKELQSVKFLQRTRGINLDPEQKEQQPDPEKVPKGNLNKHLRRQVAQALTLLRQRQIEDGIDRDASRKLFKRAVLAAGLGGL